MSTSIPTSARESWIDSTLGRLTLDQKIGQLFVFPFYGTFITPDVRELIVKHHLGGLRIAEKFAAGMSGHRTPGLSWHEQHSMAEPDAMTFDCPPGLDRTACTAAEFASALNELREMAMDRPAGVPIHTAFDQEGEGADLLFEQRLLPFPMGLRASGDPALVYRAAKAIARQARAVGGNMIHSPVVDVNTNRGNPEIGPRAYSERTEEVTTYALATLRGFQEERLVATAKHFPGRGASDQDAHFGLPVIDLDGDTMRREHIAPYKALIDAGLPAVMAAFTSYPGLGSSEPAATAPEIIQGILRQELGFRGVVTSDNTQMGGLLEKFPIGEAVVRCVIAGCDLILCRAYTPVRFQVLEATREAVRQGRVTEARLDESVSRILGMRWDMGLAENGGKVDPSTAGATFDDPEVVATANEAAARSLVVLRDRDNLIPLPRDKRILLVEQIHHFHGFINNTYSHPGLLWQEMLRVAPETAAVHIKEKPTAEDIEAVKRRLDWAEVIVATCYYNYRSGARMTPVLDVLKACGKPVVLVANTPYAQFGPTEKFGSVIVSFCPSGRENLRAVASVLTGELKASGRLDFLR
jgi:beta-N-acetylhexosaminidase